jgi:hypothetical protein
MSENSYGSDTFGNEVTLDSVGDCSRFDKIQAPEDWSHEDFASKLGFAEDLGATSESTWSVQDDLGLQHRSTVVRSPEVDAVALSPVSLDEHVQAPPTEHTHRSEEHVPSSSQGSEPPSTPELQASDRDERSSSEPTMPPSTPNFLEPSSYPVEITAPRTPPPASAQFSRTSDLPPVELKAPTSPMHRPARSAGPSAFEKVMSKTRPIFLPPKDKSEDKKHLADWETMMKQSRAAGEHRLPARPPVP